jgi:tRNA1Val (adenine37-N6)-methyltransferase
MANTYFNFKLFSIQQDRCAMKVGTDGVLLGAWANMDEVSTALDIGTGTGLIALMLAQRAAAANIDGVEIDPNAAGQAKENVEASPWASRVNIFPVPVQQFAPGESRKYDLVICNPPFFHDSYKAKGAGRIRARHSVSFTYGELVKIASNLLNVKGRLSIIIPFQDHEQFRYMAARYNLHVQRLTRVHPTPLKPPHRILAEYGHDEIKAPGTSSLVIEENGRHNYSEVYKELTGEFYLNF